MSGHIPVLLPQIIDALQPENGTVERLVDGTLGAGGHTRALLEAGVKDVLAMDLDPVAIAAARHHLAPYRRVECPFAAAVIYRCSNRR